MALNLSNFAPMLKTLYPKKRVENMVYSDRPLLAWLPKSEGFYGEDKKVPLIYGNPNGRSATFTTAQGNKTNTKSVAFLITRVKNYGLISIDNETIEASQNDAGAFAEARKVEIDGEFQNMANDMASDVVGTGSGARARLSSSVTLAGTTWSLSDADDIVKIEVGMALVLSTANGGGAVKSGVAYVISVDRMAGTFICSATQGGAAANISTIIATAAQSDYIFAQGDYDLKMSGIEAWIPYGGPSATPFFGVDRTTDPTRLAGVTKDLSSYSIEEALIQGAKYMHREGGNKYDAIWLSETKYAELIMALGAKVQYVEMKATADISFQGVKFQAHNKMVSVFCDKMIPSDKAYFLTRSSWDLASLKGAPRILNMDGLESLREATADAIEIRIGYYAQLSNNGPGLNGNFKV
jgi:hypothetical protein